MLHAAVLHGQNIAVLHRLLLTSLVCSYSLDEHRHFIGAVLKIQWC